MKRLTLIALLAGLLVVAAGCGREEAPDMVNGKTLFVQKCGSCHVLNRAGAKGIQGPNLDQAFDASLNDGMNRETVEGVVRRQIAFVRRSSTMPANLVVGDDARDVSAYVADVVGKRGQDEGELAQAGKPKVSTKPVEASNGTLAIDADPTGALAFTAVNAIAEAGRVSLEMDNEASVDHNIAVKGSGLDEKGNVVGKGGTSRLTVSLKKGEYEFYCSVPGHEAGGMKGKLEIK